MIYNFSICFFGNTLIKTTVTCFHVENWNVSFFGWNGTKTTIRIAKN